VIIVAGNPKNLRTDRSSAHRSAFPGHLASAKTSYRATLLLVVLACAATPAYTLRWRFGFYPTTLLEVTVLFSVAAFVIESWRARVWPSWPRYFTWPVLLFLLTGAISVVVAPDHIKALGLYRAYIIEPIAFFVVVTNVARTRPRALLVLAGLGFAGLLASALNIAAVLNAIHRDTFEVGGNSPVAIYDTPNALALFVGPLVAVAASIVTFDREQRVRALAAGFLAIAIAAMALSQSRGGYLTLATIALTLAFVHSRRKMLVPLGAAALLLIALVPPVTARLAHEVNFSDPSNTLASRLRLWAATIRLLSAHPIFGTGLSGFMASIGPYRNGQYSETLMYPHNIVLNAWTETGLLGLIGFVWLFFIAGHNGWRGWKSGVIGWRPIELGVLIAVLAMVAHGLVDVPYWKNDLSIEFWALVGVSCAGLPFNMRANAGIQVRGSPVTCGRQA